MTQQNEPSKAAMEAALEVAAIRGMPIYATDEEIAKCIDQAMQPEREAAAKMAEFIRKRTKHEVHMNADCPCSSCEGRRLLAAYEAATSHVECQMALPFVPNAPKARHADMEPCWNCGSFRMVSGYTKKGIGFAECWHCSASRCEAKTETKAIRLHRTHNKEMLSKRERTPHA